MKSGLIFLNSSIEVWRNSASAVFKEKKMMIYEYRKVIQEVVHVLFEEVKPNILPEHSK